jgi:hypothetical protein
MGFVANVGYAMNYLWGIQLEINLDHVTLKPKHCSSTAAEAEAVQQQKQKQYNSRSRSSTTAEAEAIQQ